MSKEIITKKKSLKNIDLLSVLSNTLAKTPLYYLDGNDWLEIMTKERVISYAKNIYYANSEEDLEFPHDMFHKSPDDLVDSIRMIEWIGEELFKITE